MRPFFGIRAMEQEGAAQLEEVSQAMIVFMALPMPAFTVIMQRIPGRTASRVL